MIKIKEPEHVLRGKVGQLFRNMLRLWTQLPTTIRRTQPVIRPGHAGAVFSVRSSTDACPGSFWRHQTRAPCRPDGSNRNSGRGHGPASKQEPARAGSFRWFHGRGAARRSSSPLPARKKSARRRLAAVGARLRQRRFRHGPCQGERTAALAEIVVIGHGGLTDPARGKHPCRR